METRPTETDPFQAAVPVARKGAGTRPVKSTKATTTQESRPSESVWLRRVSLRETNKPKHIWAFFLLPFFYLLRENNIKRGGGLHSVTAAEQRGYVLAALIMGFLCNGNRVTTDSN